MRTEMKNVYPDPSLFIKRVGYYGFVSMIWTLWKMNKRAKQLGIQCKAEIIFPIRWLR